MSNEFPLISVAFISYNQELYVREALLSILDQDYPNLEVVISDDASTDQSCKIIEEVCDGYDGPISIKVCNSIVNHGIAKNVSKVLELCDGEYIALSAGDDISIKSRITESLSAIRSKAGISAIFANLIKIDNSGNDFGAYFKSKPTFCQNIDEFLNKERVWCIGASLFFDANVFNKYGCFLEGTYQEDGAIAFRAILSGGIEFLDKKLVRYRFHENNASQSIGVEAKVKFKLAELKLLDNMMKDFLVSGLDRDKVYFEIVRRKVVAKFTSLFLKYKLVSSSIFAISNVLRRVNIRRR